MRISDWSSDVCSSDLEEQDALPAFRRENYISAYGEGWGLYSEDLGVEMGIYETPYEDFGRLTYAMWRACRLVIDTGIHHMGWTRDQALAYLRERTALSEHEVTTRSEEHTSELKSLMRISYAVFCLKKKKHILYPMYV